MAILLHTRHGHYAPISNVRVVIHRAVIFQSVPFVSKEHGQWDPLTFGHLGLDGGNAVTTLGVRVEVALVWPKVGFDNNL